MKKSRHTEEQVAYALRLAESGTPVADVCRQTGIAEATFYLWKKKYGSLGVPEVRELRQMREENARLKRPPFGELEERPAASVVAALQRTSRCGPSQRVACARSSAASRWPPVLAPRRSW